MSGRVVPTGQACVCDQEFWNNRGHCRRGCCTIALPGWVAAQVISAVRTMIGDHSFDDGHADTVTLSSSPT